MVPRARKKMTPEERKRIVPQDDGTTLFVGEGVERVADCPVCAERRAKAVARTQRWRSKKRGEKPARMLQETGEKIPPEQKED